VGLGGGRRRRGGKAPLPLVRCGGISVCSKFAASRLLPRRARDIVGGSTVQGYEEHWQMSCKALAMIHKRSDNNGYSQSAV
jgi:hypothetical protein